MGLEQQQESKCLPSLYRVGQAYVSNCLRLKFKNNVTNSIGRIIKTTENGPKDRCNIFNNLETKNKNFLNFRNENQNLSNLTE